jgi:hypothetical protein
MTTNDGTEELGNNVSEQGRILQGYYFTIFSPTNIWQGKTREYTPLTIGLDSTGGELWTSLNYSTLTPDNGSPTHLLH